MKKLLIISISIMIVLALASSVMAKAVQLELAPYAGNDEEGWGNVILNNPAGTVDLIMLVNIKNAAPDTTYTVWIITDGISWVSLGEILTNKAGNGSFKNDLKDVVDGPLEITGIVVALNCPMYSTKYITDQIETGEIEIK
jgi:hypothetical protein